ncbi:MAG TPA: S16 family serine protease, partial [Bacteroidota bacterium]|nr:S16 family serine protease [Bacteroidota bacterium]
VLPIGGLKEKVLAAHRAGIKTILLPERNRMDLEDIPKSALEGKDPIQFHFVREMGEVIELSLLSSEESSRTASPPLGLHPAAAN